MHIKSNITIIFCELQNYRSIKMHTYAYIYIFNLKDVIIDINTYF